MVLNLEPRRSGCDRGELPDRPGNRRSDPASVPDRPGYRRAGLVSVPVGWRAVDNATHFLKVSWAAGGTSGCTSTYQIGVKQQGGGTPGAAIALVLSPPGRRLVGAVAGWLERLTIHRRSGPHRDPVEYGGSGGKIRGMGSGKTDRDLSGRTWTVTRSDGGRPAFRSFVAAADGARPRVFNRAATPGFERKR